MSTILKSCFVLEDYYSSARHWILQDCQKFSFTKRKSETQ